MYGDSAVNQGYEVELSPSAYPVSPGDCLTASVSVSGSTWTLALTDHLSSGAQRWSSSTGISYSGAARSSAEWVVERPEICSRSCSLASLADFGSVSFSGASTTTTSGTGSISSVAATPIEMVSGSTVLALPGALDSAGDASPISGRRPDRPCGRARPADSAGLPRLSQPGCPVLGWRRV